MLEVNNLLPTFAKYNLADKDVTFIKELISGAALEENSAKVCVFVLISKELTYLSYNPCHNLQFWFSLFPHFQTQSAKKIVYILPHSILVKSYRPFSK